MSDQSKSQQNILIAVPTMGAVHPILTKQLINWGRKYNSDQLRVHFFFTFKVSFVDRARNQIVNFFLNTTLPDGATFSHLLFIDSDTLPPEDAIDRILAADKDIVSGLTPILRYSNEDDWEVYDNAFEGVKKNDDGKIEGTFLVQRHTGLRKIFRCGTSCLLIKRRVFEGLPKPYFMFDFNEDGTHHKRSEDIRFCDMAREAGFELYADSEVICQHAKDIII